MPNLLGKPDYPDAYIEACFRAWYDAGSPQLKTSAGTVPIGGMKIMKFMPPSPDGRMPSIITIRQWMERFGWRERADVLDAEVSIRLDKEAIRKRIKVLDELADTGKKIMDKGLKYVLENENPFADNPSAAVRAIISGAEMQFKYAGAADKLALITQMSDKQIEREILQLLGKPTNENENNENNEDVVDVESEDIPSEDDDSTEDDNS